MKASSIGSFDSFYNLAFLAAKPDDILATLRGLNRKGMAIKTVVYGMEPIAFTDIKYYGPAYQLHPEVAEQSRPRIIFDYLITDDHLISRMPESDSRIYLI